MTASEYKVYYSVSNDKIGYKGAKSFASEDECRTFAKHCKDSGWEYEVIRFGIMADQTLLDASWWIGKQSRWLNSNKTQTEEA